MKASSGWKSVFLLLALHLWLNPIIPAKGHAYVMPAEQIVQFMAPHFSKFQTMVIHQSTRVEDLEGNEVRVFDEILTMKSPNFFHSKSADPAVEVGWLKERSYWQLFLASDGPKLMGLFHGLGMRVRKTGYTRIDGIIAYRIGEGHEDSPKLLVEKERFLPLLMVYRPPFLPEGEVVTVRFLDYRRVQQGWLPFEMTCAYGQRPLERYTIKSVKVNVPVSQSLFDPAQ